MVRYVSRHGQCATVDTPTELTDLGSDGTGLDPIKVLPGEKSIKEIWVVPGNEAATKTACGGPVTFRISGSGVVDGPHEVLGHGYTCLATGNTAFYRIRPAMILKVEIGLVEGGDIIIHACQDGTDAGTPNPGCTLVITDVPPARKCKYETRFASIASVDTSTAMNLAMGTVTRATVSPGKYKRITRIWTTYANELPLATAAGGSCIGKITSGLAMGDFDLVFGGHGSLSTTTGSTVGYYPIADTGLLNVPLSGNPISLTAEQNGVDHGTAMPSVTVELSE